MHKHGSGIHKQQKTFKVIRMFIQGKRDNAQWEGKSPQGNAEGTLNIRKGRASGVAQLVGALPCKPSGGRFDSQSGYIPRP